jgi:iron(III) transport system substrate-binding protein
MLVVACSDDSDNQATAVGTRELVTVYSSLDEAQTAPLFRAYEKSTGDRVQQVTADDDRLLEMMLDKRRAPAADLYIANGAALLGRAVQRGIFRPTYADELDATVPSRLRDPENLWFGIALTANVLVVNGSLLKTDEPGSYESLAEDKWAGGICLSSSTLLENIAFIAWLIERHGQRDAELIVRRILANLAMPLFDDVPSLVAAVGLGQCDVGIAALDAVLAQQLGGAVAPVRVVLPPAASGGTQIDVVAAGVTRHAGNPDGARKLLLWLVSDAGQRLVADSKLALPASPTVGMPGRVSASGSLEQSTVEVFRLAQLSENAFDLAERARYR